jgi:hypothetical protein
MVKIIKIGQSAAKLPNFGRRFIDYPEKEYWLINWETRSILISIKSLIIS